MKFHLLAVTLFSCISHGLSVDNQPVVDHDEVAEFLKQVNHNLAAMYNKEVHANWQNEVLGPNNLVALLESEIANREIIRYIKSISPKIKQFRRLHIASENMKRQLSLIPVIGYGILPPDDLELMYSVTANMSDRQHSLKMCSYKMPVRCDLSLLPQVQDIIHSSRDPNEIEYYWLEWRRRSGDASRKDFRTFIQTYRKSAAMSGFATPGDYWYKDFRVSSSDMGNVLEKLMQQLKPLFTQFHAYIRGNLRKIYGTSLIPQGKPYPQHLAEIFISNMKRKESVLLESLPYPEVPMINISESLKRKGFTNARGVFWHMANFFKSMGFPQLEDEFWEQHAMPTSSFAYSDSACWHKAWKYYQWNSVNFTYCPLIDEDRFYNMFESLCDLYYYQAYKDQPTLFQDEPYPQFSDALGKVFSLAASSPRYLEKLKLVDKEAMSKESRLNHLYIQGLRLVFHLPIFFVLDRYRLDIMDGKLNVSNNCAYWHLTDIYTGAEPPVPRKNSDFDAPAKLLMEVDDEYSSQLLGVVLQFQVYKHFCELTGQYVPGDSARPLDMCDLSNQRAVGRIIWPIMSLGASANYRELLPYLTNSTEFSMQGFLEYFQPLHKWLEEENHRHNYEVGWDRTQNCQ